MKRGIKGKLKLPKTEEILKRIEEKGDDLLKEVNELGSINYWIYLAEFEEKEIVCVEYYILSNTYTSATGILTNFKGTLKKYLGKKPTVINTIKFDKI